MSMEFLTFLGNLLVFLLVLTAIISIHELGHFLLAKKAGILIHEFSIGMGPVLYQKRKGETAYSLRAIPLGGYVSMSGEDGDHSLIQKGSMIGVNLNEIGLIKEIILDQTIANPSLVGEVIDFDLYGENLKELFIELRTSEGTLQRYQVMRDAKYLFRKTKQLHITPHESSFSSKTKWERFLVLIFGSFMNFLLAFTVLIIVAIVAGKPHEHNIVDESMNLALKPGDTIVAINDLSTENIHDIRNALNATNHHYVFADLLRDDLLLEDEKV